ncbi:LTA synthase family protein [Paracandidimonas soli]|uniref:Phosphoglycerol transferase MdoB-like AlkP superfamily enzyme n=1 Tax=Paracandidimonas soli TaxID=1917182 RepID=A0A4R3V4T3_9BURK|nr:LTA synthase family protein [Paracandidimonas soli]TCU98353.1 phosphoglycerol transferase MdoB-like AlkP superfamily enzyme [Paracandidimonas soli]
MKTLISQTLKFLFLIFAAVVLSKLIFTLLNPNLRALLSTEGNAASLLWGLKLDLSATAALSLLATLAYFAENFWSRRFPLTRIVLLACLFWAVGSTAVDAIYTQDVGRHITFELFTGADMEGGLIGTALSDYPAHSAIALLLLAVSAILCKRLALPGFSIHSSYAGLALFWVASIGLPVTAVRGGWMDVPQTPMSVYNIGSPEQAKLAWNAPYAMTYYLRKGSRKAARQLSAAPREEDLQRVRQWAAPRAPALDGLKHANIILVLLESWTAADLHSYAAEADAAPFFDSLRAGSFSTSSMYADAQRTVEGMFSVFCSFPNPIGTGVAGTQLQTLPYRCLPRLLQEAGWQTHFVQGSGKGIVGAFAQSLGFEHSYGKSDPGFEGPTNHWGYMDDGVYAFAQRTMQALPFPFFMAINTNSTHDTFLPDEADYIYGKESPVAIRRAVTRHADGALERFIKAVREAAKEPTLVVLVADHTKTADGPGTTGKAIPFLMFSTDGSLPAQHRHVNASQRDIAPTIMEWLGGYVPWFTGKSLLNGGYDGKASFSQGSIVNWLEKDRMISFDSANEAAPAQCFNLDDAGLSQTRTACDAPDFRAMLEDALAYTRYTQDLLFSGKTAQYPFAPGEALRSDPVAPPVGSNRLAVR